MTDYPNALPPDHRLREYRIAGVLGCGGFGITYCAEDTLLDKLVAVKEFLPNEFALRTDATTVQPRSGTDDKDYYQWGLARFLEEAKTLARFKHPHLNEVYRYFEDNGTAYIVLDYIEGKTLSQLLRREPRLDEDRLRRLLEEMLSGLEKVHGAGFVHRDIKPGNIMLRKDDGSAVLLDFGAARQAVGQRSKLLTSILTPGYAPIEQYAQKAEDIGPWSDIYALGMVAYRCLSGLGESGLPNAVDRVQLERKGGQDKSLKPALEIGKGRYSESLLTAVDWAIKVDEGDRPQNVAVLREVLDDRAAPLTPAGNAGAEQQQELATRPAPAVPGGGQGDRTQARKISAVGFRPPTPDGGQGDRTQARTISAAGFHPPAPDDGQGGRKKGKAAWVLPGVLVAAGAAAGWFVAGEEWLYWRSVRCAEAEAVRGYIERYPAGRFQGKAQACLTEQKQRKEETESNRLAEEKRKAEAERQRTEDARRVAEAGRQLKEEAKRAAEAERQRTEEAERAAEAERQRKEEAERAAETERQRTEKAKRAAAKAERQRTEKAERAAETERQRFARITGHALSPRYRDANGWTDMHTAAVMGSRALIEYLLDAGADMNARLKNDEEPFTGELQAMLRRMGQGGFAGQDRNGETPLHLAARGNIRKAAKYLVAHGADVHVKADVGGTPLHYTAFGNAREVAEYLVAHGADVHAKNDYGNTPLHYAAQENAREVAEYLVEDGADVHAKNNYGNTPLHVAAFGNAREAAEYLVEVGADVHAKTNDGWTPLHLAAYENAREAAEYLVARGADVHAKNNNGMTPLHGAARQNAREIAEYLVEGGADVHAKDNDGQTPLHVAARQNAREVAEYLVARGADVHAKNNAGEMPLRLDR